MQNSKITTKNPQSEIEKQDLKLAFFFFCVGVVLAAALILPSGMTG